MDPFITLDDRILSPIIASYTQQAEDASPENATAQWNQPDLDQSVDEFPESNLDLTTEVMDEHTRPDSFSGSANKANGPQRSNECACLSRARA